MKFIHNLILCVALAVAPTVASAGVLGIDGEDATSVGIYIKDLSTGEVLVDCNSRLALTPASTMKAITTASVLSTLPSDSTFVTVAGLTGHADGSTWQGNLVIKSSGDPTLESENFKSHLGFCDSIVAALTRRGIRRIARGIVVEQTLPDAGPILQWEVEDIAWPYGTALHGFNFRDNYTHVTPATGKIDPPVPGFEMCVEEARHNDLVRGVYSNRLYVYTRDPHDTKWTIGASVPDPSAMFEAEMRAKLADAGISVGEPMAADSAFTPLFTARSMPFAEIMKSLMVRSDNLFAEGMLRTLAPGAPRMQAIAREKAMWTDRGIDASHTKINDGSGLTHSNRLSPRFMAEVLEWMARSPKGGEYVRYFPRAGRDGTMRGFLAKSKLKGQIALKTGSISGVQCYAGYKLNQRGEPTHVVVIMVNGFFCPRKEVREAAENLLTDLFLK